MSHITIGVRSNALTVSTVVISDIGFLIPSGGALVEFTDDLLIAKLLQSEDLVTLSNDNAFPAAAPGNENTLILTDGTSDIPPGGTEDFLGGIEQGRFNNCAASGLPTAGDDISLGYTPCSRWVITSGPDIGRVFVNYKNDLGAAAWTELSGGGTSGDLNVEVLLIEFEFTDGGVLTTFLPNNVLNAGDIVINSEIDIETAYDDVASQIRLGIPSSPGLFLDITDNDPTNVAVYGGSANYKSIGSDTIRLTHVPGTSTQGKGSAIVTVRRA